MLRERRRQLLAVGMRTLAGRINAKLTLQVSGTHFVPRSGPALLVCRHYHHLYDGSALFAVLPRPLHIVVALDWADRPQRFAMEALCRLAAWPVVLRDPRIGYPWGNGYSPSERTSYARRALSDSVAILKDGCLLAIFPEGSPLIDPVAVSARARWPEFRSGFLRIALRAAREGLDVPIIPTGLRYVGPAVRPNSLIIRFGEPAHVGAPNRRRDVARDIQERVRALSA